MHTTTTTVTYPKQNPNSNTSTVKHALNKLFNPVPFHVINNISHNNSNEDHQHGNVNHNNNNTNRSSIHQSSEMPLSHHHERPGPSSGYSNNVDMMRRHQQSIDKRQNNNSNNMERRTVSKLSIKMTSIKKFVKIVFSLGTGGIYVILNSKVKCETNLHIPSAFGS